MSIKEFKPQLKSDIFINFSPKMIIVISLFFGIFVFTLFNFIGEFNSLFTVGISIFFIIFTYFLFSDLTNRVKLWDMGAPYTIKIDTNKKTIYLDNIHKFNIQQIDYIDIEEYEPKSSLYGMRLYYSVINAVMKFYLKDGEVLNFPVQNATKLIQIINLLRELGANVKNSITEDEHDGANMSQWFFLICIIVLGIILYISNN